MEIPICNYGNCDSTASIACMCAPNPVLLCQTHTFEHMGNLPGKEHAFQELYLSIQPHEQEAFFSAQTFLISAENTRKKTMATDYSQRTKSIVSELKETTSRLLRRLKETNQTHLNDLKELNEEMNEMRLALNEVGKLGIPILRSNAFSTRLETLKKDSQVFAYSDVLKEIKSYWEQQGMDQLSQLLEAQGQSVHVQLTDQLQFTQIRKHQITTNGPSDISFSLDGRYYAAGSDNNTVKVWNAANGELIHSLEGHTDQVHSVSFSPDSESLASGSKDTTIGLWTLLNGKATIKQLKGHLDEVNSVVFSNNGELIASGSSDQTVGNRRKPTLLTPRTFRCSLFSVFLAR